MHSEPKISIVVLLVLIATAMTVHTTGCSNGGDPNTVVIIGTATFDGRPIDVGRVLLEDATNPNGKPYAAAIHDGQFNIATSPGKKTVRITATRYEASGKMSAAMKKSVEQGVSNTIPVQYIPECYNSKTDLQVHITPTGNAPLAFDLQK